MPTTSSMTPGPPGARSPIPAIYGTTLTRPEIFADYYRAQIERLMQLSRRAGRRSARARGPFRSPSSSRKRRRISRSTRSARCRGASRCPISPGSTTASPMARSVRRTARRSRLSLFPAERVDLALQRIHHYTATEPAHFQRFVLFTNYQRYVTAFAEAAVGTLKRGSDGYTSVVLPDNRVLGPGEPLPPAGIAITRRRCRPIISCARTGSASASSTSASAPRTPRRSPIIWRCCARIAG